ncbi:Transmembrane protein 45B [Holothuria leucospilota]|uniref:Transmembrane protein 45B n=1 Tax=Holothuria leucospilota TaxID=206669 RepID=A0A9Q1BFD9_HOLLE|nr:Transmembrane protein 45B [Holothuria leucospilota]
MALVTDTEMEGRDVFFGHLASGASLVCISVFWILKYSITNSTRHDQEAGSRKPKRTIVNMFRMVPWEGCILLACGCFAVVRVFRNPYFQFAMINNDGNFSIDSLRGWQHTMLYFTVAMYGLIIFLADAKFPKLAYYVKPFGTVTFVVFGNIFALHNIVKEPVDSQIHVLLVICCYGTAVSFALEATQEVGNAQTVFFIMRVFFSFLQGTWLIHSAYILDPPSGQPWDQQDKINLMFISTAFILHFVVDFWFVLLLYCCVSKIFCRKPNLYYDMLKGPDYEMNALSQDPIMGA